MKKSTLSAWLTLCLLLSWQATTAQAVRNDVILEIATGNWCYYCPGSALGADDLAAAGANVGIVEHHDNDVHTYASSDARNAYYAVQGFPTAWFDGANEIVGGDHALTMYPSYRTKYDQAIAAPTPFDLSASWVQNGSSVDVTVSVTQMGAYTGGNLRIQTVLTESGIAANWQGMTHNDYVNRIMYPDHNGTPITTSQGGPAVTNTFTIAIDPSWVQQAMELVVWVEDGSTHEILNGKMLPLSTAANAVDIALVSLNNQVAHQSCMTDIAPEVMIHNMGNDPLTAATFTYDVNGGTPTTFNWTGNLAYYDYVTVALPSIAFAPQTNNDLNIAIVVPSDANANDNVQLLSWQGASTHAAGVYKVFVKPDLYGSETTWDIKNSAGTVIASGGPYFDGNRLLITTPVTVGTNDCFSFGIYDEFGDGIGTSSPPGWYMLQAPNGDTIFRGGVYEFADYVDFKTDGTVANAPILSEEVSVSPNPSNGLFKIQLPQAYADGATVTVWAADGQQVLATVVTDASTTIDLSRMATGMYMMRVTTANGVTIKKLHKN